MVYAIRNLERHLPAVQEWTAHPPLHRALQEILGTSPLRVRAILFDKPPQRSWWLPWHRDTAIPARGTHPEFTHPTVKAGVPHLEAPRRILDRMITARIHLDPARVDNGALEVVPGSHLREDHEIVNPRTITCEAGDVLLMRPRILHRSSRSAPGHTARRRVIHLEFAPADLLPSSVYWVTARTVL